jgi:putative pyruvate formate lyase activating enzyme
MSTFKAAYLATYEAGLLADRLERAFALLEACTLCPRKCGVNRLRGEKGFCRAGGLPAISSYGPHFGEERPLVGSHGSGTIFMTYCNLGCIFCQNYSISRLGEGRTVSFDELSSMMVELQRRGCHNINFVSPSHFVPHIMRALPGAIEMGLSVPLVYNTGGYDAVNTLTLLDGIFDIYMPDFKYARKEVGEACSQVPDYPEVAARALKEMHRQTGDLVMDERAVALRGLLVRHLVLPGGMAGTREVMHFLAAQISRKTYVNIMDQYHPRGDLIPPGSPLARRITGTEFREAVRMAKEEGLARIDCELS